MRVALSRKWIIRPWQIEACGLYLGQHVVIVGLVALFQHVLQSVGVPPVNGAHGYSVLDPFMW